MTFKPYDQRTKESDRFAMLPMVLLEDDLYKGKLDMASVVAYSLLRNRQSLSIDTGWVDTEGNVYCYYSRENLAEVMNVSVRSIDKIFKQLKDVDLIKTVRQGLNKPNRIYVGLPDYSGPAKSAHQDMQDMPTIKNESLLIKKELKQQPNHDRVLVFLNDSSITFIKMYDKIYKHYTKRQHPRLSIEQMDRVELRVNEVLAFRGVYEEEYADMIYAYFDDYVVGKENDGNINAFIKRFESIVLALQE